MHDHRGTRLSWLAAPVLAALGTLCVFAPPAAHALPWQVIGEQAPAPIERRPPPPKSQGQSAADRVSAQPRAAARPGSRGEHLAEWMNQHRDLTPQQQQQALGREPGFRELPATTQQRMRERLAQLDAMSPEQRQRALARTEAMERLTPEQREEVRSAMSQLGNLPEDQRKVVARTFRSLRDLPPEQRISAYASGRYGQLTDPQRNVLFDLLRVEPMLPPPPPAQNTTPSLPPNAQTFR